MTEREALAEMNRHIEALQSQGSITARDAAIKVRDAWLQARAAAPATNPAPGYCKHCKQYTVEEPLAAAPAGESRPRTYYPGDNPFIPCPQKYALSECKATDDLLAVTASELYSSLKFIRTHLYAAQAQMNDFDDAIISRHVYDAYKRIDDLCREIAVHGVSIGRVEE